MKRIPLLSLILFFSLLLSNCSSDKKELPNTPEKVARQWQDWIDQNEYQKAKELSTGNAIEWINWAEETIKASGEEPEVLSPAVFLSMKCEEFESKAICDYIMDDEGRQFRDSFFLKNINGQWLVDIPEEDLLEDDDIQELFDAIQKSKEETLSE
ncbi:MAG: hypothetical protein AB8F74_04710 [Saprospiraceae bacterium]